MAQYSDSIATEETVYRTPKVCSKGKYKEKQSINSLILKGAAPTLRKKKSSLPEVEQKYMTSVTQSLRKRQ